MNEILALIKYFIDKHLYGSIEVKFEAGKIVTVKKTESIQMFKHP